MPRAWRGAGPRLGKQQYPVCRHERVPDDDVLAAGAGEPADEPIVDDLAILDRQQEERALKWGLLAGRADHRTELAPLRDVAAAGEGPTAGQAIATLDRDRGAGRRKAGEGERVGVACPQFALRLDRPMRQRIAVRHRAVDGPAGRGTGGRDRQRDPERDFAVIFEAAEHPWPAGAQQLGIPDLPDDLWQ